MIRPIKLWLKEEWNVEMPEGNINGEWFQQEGLPIITSCTCCGTTMALPSAMVDDEGFIYCRSCVGEE